LVTHNRTNKPWRRAMATDASAAACRLPVWAASPCTWSGSPRAIWTPHVVMHGCTYFTRRWHGSSSQMRTSW
jgi:hypothetical protein